MNNAIINEICNRLDFYINTNNADYALIWISAVQQACACFDCLILVDVGNDISGTLTVMHVLNKDHTPIWTHPELRRYEYDE